MLKSSLVLVVAALISAPSFADTCKVMIPFEKALEQNGARPDSHSFKVDSDGDQVAEPILKLLQATPDNADFTKLGPINQFDVGNALEVSMIKALMDIANATPAQMADLEKQAAQSGSGQQLPTLPSSGLEGACLTDLISAFSGQSASPSDEKVISSSETQTVTQVTNATGPNGKIVYDKISDSEIRITSVYDSQGEKPNPSADCKVPAKPYVMTISWGAFKADSGLEAKLVNDSGLEAASLMYLMYEAFSGGSCYAPVTTVSN